MQGIFATLVWSNHHTLYNLSARIKKTLVLVEMYRGTLDQTKSNFHARNRPKAIKQTAYTVGQLYSAFKRCVNATLVRTTDKSWLLLLQGL